MGYRKMNEVVPRVMRAQQCGLPGTFDRHNHHGGVMPGWPKESTLTNLRVSKILSACIQCGKLTMGNLETIRKTLSYLWELTGKKTKKESNWPCVGALFESTVRPEKVLPKKREVMPTRIPTPEELRTAINTGWRPSCGVPFLQWLGMYICFWDSQICGARATVDMEKVKKSRTHDYNFNQGWLCTKMVNGRAKLTGLKKGRREWWMWRICMCKTKKHVRPPQDAWSWIDDDGNPTGLMGSTSAAPWRPSRWSGNANWPKMSPSGTTVINDLSGPLT